MIPPNFPLSRLELIQLERDALRRHQAAKRRRSRYKLLALGIALGVALGTGLTAILIAATEVLK